MRNWCRSILVLLVVGGFARAGEAVKLRTLTGHSAEGDLMRITPKEIVLQSAAGPSTTAVAETLDVVFSGNSVATTELGYSDVELIDGSVLHCTEFHPKGDQVRVKLVSGQELTFPLRALVSYLHDAQDARVRDEWQTLQSKKGNFDILAVRDREGKVNVLEGTFGTGDDAGSAIDFESSGGLKRQLAVSRIHAMAFARKEGTPDLPAIACKVYDTARDVLAATQVLYQDDRFTIATATGGRIEYGPQSLVRLDFSQGKLAYLSDLEPVKVSETSTMGLVDHYRRDRNLDDGPLRVVIAKDERSDAQTFAKGLALHATADLVYDLGGQYNEFKAVLGVDPNVGGDSRVRLTIEGGGRELLATEISRKEPGRAVSCDVKGVRQLRIRVSPAGALDLGCHVNLADARVTK